MEGIVLIPVTGIGQNLIRDKAAVTMNVLRM
jgi:hypothetical protein